MVREEEKNSGCPARQGTPIPKVAIRGDQKVIPVMFGVAEQITVTERVASVRMCSVDNMLLAER